MVIDNKYDIGQTVFLVTDENQTPRLVTCILILPGELLYELSCGTTNSKHYDFEISSEKSIVNT